MIKAGIVFSCIVGVALTWFLSGLVLHIHAVHGYSTVVEFESLDLINKANLDELRKDPRYVDYSIYRRVRDIGATSHHFEIFCFVITLVFIVIAVFALSIPPADPPKEVIKEPE
jgi:hypothetical protein